MLRRAMLTTAVFALGAVALAPQAAARTELFPGVTYEFGVEFTTHGPVALHVVSAPRPTGLFALRPVLSNETIVNTERVTSMQRRLAPLGTMVGINADFWTWATGRPSGVLIQDGAVISPPAFGRSSVGVTADGTLDVRRVSLFGTWHGSGTARVLNHLNKEPGPNQISLFTSAWGPSTPRTPRSVAVVLSTLPATVPNVELAAPVAEVLSEPSVAIPPGGAVLVARGSAADALLQEVLPGSNVVFRFVFKPDWSSVVNAVGGGPIIVRDGTPVFRANEQFTTIQIAPRSPRTAIGQRADGSILLVVVDGRRRGYSIGMTNFELAQTMVRLGAVTASALDSGGSSTLAFNGRLLNRPSDPGGERWVSTALMLNYVGVFIRQPTPVVSPNGDGVDDVQRLRVKVARPSTVTATLVAPDGSVAYTETTQRAPGISVVPFPPVPPPPAEVPAPSPPPPAPETAPEGSWSLTVSATDDLGQASSMVRNFAVNGTLGFLTASKRATNLEISWRQTHEARVVVTVESASGEVVRTLAQRDYEPGTPVLRWNRLVRRGERVRVGRYLIRVVASNALGTSQLVRRFAVQR
jgi:hypothetical protein